MSSQPTVLVIDDDHNILAAFEDFLRRENCSMIGVTSAEEALQKLEGHRVDLLVTDVRLKLHSGVTLLLHVKAIHPKLPVIVITGYPDRITEAAAKTYGADYFLLKPLELNKLRDAVRTCLHMNGKP
ncbi:MAG: response regulator [Ignavibacteriales bacterium]|nr:response regulator [Ignavibacteriales bacterium]